jgi:hypothetical protein
MKQRIEGCKKLKRGRQVEGRYVGMSKIVYSVNLRKTKYTWK